MTDQRLVTWAQLKRDYGCPFSRTHAVGRLMPRGEFPMFIRLGQARVVWRLSEYLAWVDARAAATQVPPLDSE